VRSDRSDRSTSSNERATVTRPLNCDGRCRCRVWPSAGLPTTLACDWPLKSSAYTASSPSRATLRNTTCPVGIGGSLVPAGL
jgi:hypothetical protein